MKKSILILLAVILSVSMLFMGIGCKEEAAEETTEEVTEEVTEEEAEEAEEEAEEEATEEVPEFIEVNGELLINPDTIEPCEIALATWETTRTEEWAKIIEAFNEIYPQITVDYQAIDISRHYQKMLIDLELGTGADVIRFQLPYSEQMLATGSVLEFNSDTIPTIDNMLGTESFMTSSGDYYGMTQLGHTQGWFYRKSVFEQLGLGEPTTWEEFLDICKTIKENGITPIAIGTGSATFTPRVWFSTIGVDFWGGEEGRQKLKSGEILINEDGFLDTFKALNDIRPYIPDDWVTITAADHTPRVVSQECAMMIHITTGITSLEKNGEEDLDAIGWFDSPPPAGKENVLSVAAPSPWFVNKSSRNLQAAKALLNWMGTKEYMDLCLEVGFTGVPMMDGDFDLGSDLANECSEMYKTAENRCLRLDTNLGLDDQDPGLVLTLADAVVLMWEGTYTPEEAAQYVYDEVSTWYEPWQ